MKVMLPGGTVAGTVVAPPSKSMTHRWLIAAALSGGGTIRRVSISDDVAATLRALSALGYGWSHQDGTLSLVPALAVQNEVDCGESGTTLRLLMPVFAAMGKSATFSGTGNLPHRPIAVMTELLASHGVTVSAHALPITVTGQLNPGDYRLPGNVSSQFVSGLLFALPLLPGDSTIRLTTPPVSAGYVKMTAAVLAACGVAVTELPGGWSIRGDQTYHHVSATVEGDWSQAAFLLAAGLLGGSVTVTGLPADTNQGDRAILGIFRQMGGEITEDAAGVTARKSALSGITVDVTDTPDLVPVLAVLAATAKGTTRIFGAARLRHKESDRLAAIADCLCRVGGKVTVLPDGLMITGVDWLIGGTVPSYRDHRIAMSMAVASFAAASPITVEQAECVSKSWPDFFDALKDIGGNCHVIHVG